MSPIEMSHVTYVDPSYSEIPTHDVIHICVYVYDILIMSYTYTYQSCHLCRSVISHSETPTYHVIHIHTHTHTHTSYTYTHTHTHTPHTHIHTHTHTHLKFGCFGQDLG